MLVWTLGLFSGSALGAAIYVLPIVALTAIGLRVYDSVRNTIPEHSLPRQPASTQPASTPARSLQTDQATPAKMPGRSSTEHARAA